MLQTQKQRRFQNTILPEAKFASNDAELNYLRKRMLAFAFDYLRNFYDKQIREKNQQQNLSKRQSSLNTPRTTSENYINENPENFRLPTHQEPTYYQLNQMQIDRQRLMKMQLARQYEQQMMRKSNQRRANEQRKRKQDATILQGIKQLREIQDEKRKKYHEINRNNMREHILVMERNKTEKQQQKRRDRQSFNKRYGMGRNQSQGALEYSSKHDQFKRHFQNVNQAQQEIQRVYLTKWSPIIQKREQQKERLVNDGIFKTQQAIDKKDKSQTQAEQRLITNLKVTLAQQILNEYKRKEELKNEKKNEQYTTKDYQNVYSPICNPVDFRITRDNKYIMRELREEKYQQDRQTGSTSESQMTGLARKGSFTLLSK